MENYENFKKFFYDLSRIDLNAYKEKQMRRRIETLIARRGLDSFDAYSEKLKSDEEEFEFFKDYITINVTEFFRTPEQWKFLEEKVIPVLVENSKKSDRKLKIWSAGCSIGDEPYSLAMLLLKFFPTEKFEILATDIEEASLEKAKAGIFAEDGLENISAEFLEQYFEPISLSNLAKVRFKIKEEVKNQITFKKMDMTQEEFPTDCDLIVCRNVLIYFTDETKQKIFSKFHESLKKGGVLFLGHAEQIVFYKYFGFEKIARNFYRR